MPRVNKNSRKLSLIVLCLALAGMGLRLLHGQPAKAAPKQDSVPAVPVTVAHVAQGAVPIELTGLGHVQAFNEVTVRPQVSGQIVKIAYKQGALVQKGALLVQIDPATFQAKFDQDDANEQRDQASFADAELNLSRFVPLARNGYTSAEQMDTQRSMVAIRTVRRLRPIKRLSSRMNFRWKMPRSPRRSPVSRGCVWSMWGTWCSRMIPLGC